jgi:transposase
MVSRVKACGHGQTTAHPAMKEARVGATEPGGRPRLISDGDIEVIVTAARTRPGKPVLPFTRWSLRKLAGYLAGLGRPVRIGRERLRQVLHERGISFQRTWTWKESADPDRDAKLDRIEYVTSAAGLPALA